MYYYYIYIYCIYIITYNYMYLHISDCKHLASCCLLAMLDALQQGSLHHGLSLASFAKSWGCP